MPRPGPRSDSMSGPDRSSEQSYAAAVCRASEEIDHGIGARSRRQCDIERRLVIEHRVWPIEETTHLRLVVKHFEPKGEHLGDTRQTIALVSGQKLLVFTAAFQGRLGYDTIGEAADILRTHPACKPV